MASGDGLELAPGERLVDEGWQDCPYLPGRRARLPLREPPGPVLGAELDRALARGDRRAGVWLYRPACPGCTACEPLRIPVERFRSSRSQRRAWRRNRDLRASWHDPQVTRAHLALFERHRRLRGLDRGQPPISALAYWRWLVESCTVTQEIRYHLDGRLVGVAIVDVGEEALSAVYTYYEPELSRRRSLGVFSILYELEAARRMGMRYLYLGYYVAGCPAMAYKARYLPHERLLDGRWRPFERGGADGGPAEGL